MSLLSLYDQRYEMVNLKKSLFLTGLLAFAGLSAAQSDVQDSNNDTASISSEISVDQHSLAESEIQAPSYSSKYLAKQIILLIPVSRLNPKYALLYHTLTSTAPDLKNLIFLQTIIQNIVAKKLIKKNFNPKSAIKRTIIKILLQQKEINNLLRGKKIKNIKKKRFSKIAAALSLLALIATGANIGLSIAQRNQLISSQIQINNQTRAVLFRQIEFLHKGIEKLTKQTQQLCIENKSLATSFQSTKADIERAVLFLHTGFASLNRELFNLHQGQAESIIAEIKELQAQLSTMSQAVEKNITFSLQNKELTVQNYEELKTFAEELKTNFQHLAEKFLELEQKLQKPNESDEDSDSDAASVEEQHDVLPTNYSFNERRGALQSSHNDGQSVFDLP